jgi:DNA-binding transcriptional LysR family regulator
LAYLGGVIASYLTAHPGVSVETMLSDRYVDLLAEGIASGACRIPDEMDNVQPGRPSSLCLHSYDDRSASTGHVSRY